MINFLLYSVLYLYRFRNGKIYTYIGEVCVSVNPYKTMNIYGQNYIEQYKGRSSGFLTIPHHTESNNCLEFI